MSLLLKPLFPVGVGFDTYNAGFNQKEKNFIYSLEKAPNNGNLTSKDRYLAKHKILNNFVKFCTTSLNNYFNTVYQPKHDVKLRITQMWANYSSKNQWHHTHQHPNSFLSAVFYLDCLENSDTITFVKSHYQQLHIYSDNFNEYNCNDSTFSIEKNMFIIFPSNLTHRVDPVQSDKTRISISMNTFPVGILGNDQNCTECILK